MEAQRVGLKSRTLGWTRKEIGIVFRRALYSLSTKQEAEGLFFREHELEELWTQGSGTTEERSIIWKMRIK